MTEYLTLAAAMSGLRLLSLILAMATIGAWSGSLYRVLFIRRRLIDLAGLSELQVARVLREQDRDGARAIWVTLALSIIVFQVRWMAPGLTDLMRMRLWVFAQAAMATTQVAAIYHHGKADPRFDTRRVLLVHGAMLLGCLAFAGLAQ